jgi:transcription elongation GreA/GreB family factor
MSFKEDVYKHCLQVVMNKMQASQAALDELTSSLGNETKSTAGDKYETARAMLHIEQENTSRQLQAVKEQLTTLEALNITANTGKVINGSLVTTDKNIFFISVALSKVLVNGVAVIALSALSPLGQKLMGQGVQDRVEMNGISYIITEIV